MHVSSSSRQQTQSRGRRVKPFKPGKASTFHDRVDEPGEESRASPRYSGAISRNEGVNRMPSIRQIRIKTNNNNTSGAFQQGSRSSRRSAEIQKPHPRSLHRIATSPPRISNTNESKLTLPPFQNVSGWHSGIEATENAENLERMVILLKQQLQDKNEQLRSTNQIRRSLEDELEEAQKIHKETIKIKRKNENLECDLHSIKQELDRCNNKLEEQKELTAQREKQLKIFRKNHSEDGSPIDREELRKLKSEVKAQETLRETLDQTVNTLKQSNHEQEIKTKSLQSELNKRKKELSRVTRESQEALQKAVSASRQKDENIEELTRTIEEKVASLESAMAKLKSLQKQNQHKNAIISKRDVQILTLQQSVDGGELVKKELEATRTALAKCEGRNETLEEKIYSLKTSLEAQVAQTQINDDTFGNLKTESTRLKAKLQLAAREASEYRERLGELETQINEVREQNMRAKGDSAKFSAELNVARTEIARQKKELGSWEANCENLKYEAGQESIKLARDKKMLEQQLKDADERLKSLKTKNEALNRSVIRLETEVSDTKQQLDKQNSSSIAMKAENVKLQEKVTRLNDCIQAQEEELTSLKDDLKSTSEALLQEQGLSYASNSNSSKAKTRVEKLEAALAEKEEECKKFQTELASVRKQREDDQHKVTEKINAAKAQVLRLKRLEQELLRIKSVSQQSSSEVVKVSEQAPPQQSVDDQVQANVATELVRLQARAVALERQNEAMRNALKTNPHALEAMQEGRRSSQRQRRSASKLGKLVP